MPNHGLSPQQLGTIKTVLAPYRQHIEKVALFGSRATGKYRENSDIDLVLYGDLDQATTDRIWTAFDDSSLPIRVDVNTYKLIQYPPLKRHIDDMAVELFSRDELEQTDDSKGK